MTNSMSNNVVKLRKFKSLVNERGLDDFGASGMTFEVSSLTKDNVYVQADERNYCKVDYKREPFFIDDNGCSRDIKYCLDNNIIEEIFDIVYTKHILGDFDKVERTQSCIICGEMIHDYRNAMYAPHLDGTPVIEKGWKEGEHYVSNGNPRYFWSTTPENANIINCK